MNGSPAPFLAPSVQGPTGNPRPSPTFHHKKEACRKWHAPHMVFGSGWNPQCRSQPFTGFYDYWHPVKSSAWVVVMTAVDWSVAVPAEIVVAGAVISSGVVQSAVEGEDTSHACASTV